MTFRSSSSIVLAMGVLAGLSLAPTPAAAQTAAAKAAPVDSRQSLPVPKLANGKPDFSGVWDHPRVSDFALNSDVCAVGSVGCKSISSGPLPYTAAGLAANNQKLKFDHTAVCLPWGYLRSWNGLYPDEIVQSTEALGMFFEQNHDNRHLGFLFAQDIIATEFIFRTKLFDENTGFRNGKPNIWSMHPIELEAPGGRPRGVPIPMLSP